jgi:hypothetical protein
LPIEVIKEFADGLVQTGVPALFSPTIDPNSRYFIDTLFRLPSSSAHYTSAQGYYFPFNRKIYHFPNKPHPPPEIYYAQNYTA